MVSIFAVLWVIGIYLRNYVNAQEAVNLVASTASPTVSWSGIAISSNGANMVAAASGSGIWLSNNYGSTWTQTLSSSQTFTQVACSSTITYCVVGFDDGMKYSTSSATSWGIASDGGPNTLINPISSVAISASGSDMYGVTDSLFWYSHSYGAEATWMPVDVPTFLYIACSASGSTIAAATSSGDIYWSTNSGTSFSQIHSGFPSITGISMSGSAVAVTIVAGQIYYSNNTAGSFTESDAPYGDWTSVSVSSDGKWQVASYDGSEVYYSNTWGYNWTALDSFSASWSAVAMSETGQYIAAAVEGGNVYTNPYTPTSMPSVQPSSQPSNQPTGDPSMQPTNTPSSQPTSVPTTSFPTSKPSGQPSSFPSYIPDSVDVHAIVQSTNGNATYKFDGLGCGTEAFLSVNLIVSYLDVGSYGYVQIVAVDDYNKTIVSSYCAPTQVCQSVMCAVNFNVTDAISCSGGGSLTLVASTMNVSQQTGVDVLCTYYGTQNLQFVAEYFLQWEPFPTAPPSLAPVFAGVSVQVEASPNTPFYVIGTCVLIASGLAIYVLRLREKNAAILSPLDWSFTFVDMGLIAYHVSAELFYVILLFRESHDVVAIVVILLRSISVILASVFILLLFGPCKGAYDAIMNRAHLYKKMTIYSVLIVWMMLDHSMVRYLPWTKAEFTAFGRKFSDRQVFRLCTMSKIGRLGVSLALQLLVALYYDQSLLKGNSDSVDCAVILLYFGSTLLSIGYLVASNDLLRQYFNRVGYDTRKSYHARESNGVMTVTDNPLRAHNKRMSQIKGAELVSYSVLEERESLLKEDLKRGRQELEELREQNHSLEDMVSELMYEVNKRKVGQVV